MRSIAFLIFIAVLGQQSLAQNVPVVLVDDLEARFEENPETTFIVNFWATWCAPCVKEMPYFENLNNSNRQDLKVLLVSLDFAEHLETNLKPFISTRQVKSEVQLLNEQDDNVWIPRISESWSGAIPATLFVNQSKKTRHFHEGSFKEGELEALLKELGI